MSLDRGAKAKVRMGSELFKEVWLQVSMQRESLLLPPLFSTAVDVITENAREHLMNKILYANKLVLLSESIKNLRKVFGIERGV